MSTLTVDRIAEEAGLNVAEVAIHVDTIDDTLLAAYLVAAERFIALGEDVFETAPSWHDGVRALIEGVLLELRRRPGLDRLYYREAPASSDPRMWEARDRVRHRVVELLIAQREPDELPQLRFEMLAGVLFNAVRERVMLNTHLGEPVRVAREICEIVPIFEPEPVAV